MKFWLLLAQGRFRQAWEVLSRRPDTEHEQALVRFVLAFIATAYLYWSVHRDGLPGVQEIRLLWMCGFYVLMSVVLFIIITIDPDVSPVRRGLGIVGDLSTTSIGIAAAGGAGAPLYIILLWVIFGNGFRYGRSYLFAASAFGTFAFGTAIHVNTYWQNKLSLGIGLQAGLVVLPLYISSILTRAQGRHGHALDGLKDDGRPPGRVASPFPTRNAVSGSIDCRIDPALCSFSDKVF